MEEMQTRKTMGAIGLQEIPAWYKTTTPSCLEMMAPSNPPLALAGSFQVWTKPYLTMNLAEPGTGASNPTTPVLSLNNEPGTGASNPTTPVLSLNNEAHYQNTQDVSLLPNKDPSSINGRRIDPDMDPRKLKRIISNRVSAQKSRMKKLQYVTSMERRVKALEAQIAVLSPQVSAFKNQQHLLQMEQNSLNQQISAYANNKLIKDAEIEENKAEVNRLRKLHLKLQQRQYRTQSSRMLNWDSATGFIEQTVINPGLNQPAAMGQFVLLNSNQGGDVTVEQLNMTQEEEERQQAWMGSSRSTDGVAQTSTQAPTHVTLPAMLNFNTIISETPRN